MANLSFHHHVGHKEDPVVFILGKNIVKYTYKDMPCGIRSAEIGN